MKKKSKKIQEKSKYGIVLNEEFFESDRFQKMICVHNNKEERKEYVPKTQYRLSWDQMT